MSTGPPESNLFDRWELDPSAGPQAITEALRERMEEADAPTAVELRRAWEQLTVHPKRRIVEALTTFPETRPPVGRPPLPPRPAAPPSAPDEARVVHAPVTAALPFAAPLRTAALPPLQRDLLLAPQTTSHPHGGTK